MENRYKHAVIAFCVVMLLGLSFIGINNLVSAKEEIPADVQATLRTVKEELIQLDRKQAILAEKKQAAKDAQSDYDVTARTIETLKENLRNRGYDFDYETKGLKPFNGEEIEELVFR